MKTANATFYDHPDQLNHHYYEKTNVAKANKNLLCPQWQHCFKRSTVSCANLHDHLRTEFILNGIFRITEYNISIEEILKMNYPSSLATSSLICQRKKSGALALLGPWWS